MIVKAIRGRGFKGAVNYVANDVSDAPQRGRVDWVDCRNLPTNDPGRAGRMMAWTSYHADALKRSWNAENPDEAVKLTGRKCERPVYHLILSWAPDERPDRTEMEKAVAEALKALGMNGHEHVIAAHNDGAARHVHVVVNLVHPETGKAASLQNDRVRLQEWALRYEQAQGRIHCEQRALNFNKRAEGQNVIDFASRKRDRELDAARVKDRTTRLKEYSLSAVLRVAYPGWSGDPARRPVQANIATRTFNRAEAAIPARADPAKLPEAAETVKAQQIARMTALRARHKTQWDSYRTDWDAAFKKQRTALAEQHKKERESLKARLREDGRAAYTAARKAVIDEVRNRYKWNFEVFKVTYQNRMRATFGLNPKMPRGYWQALRTDIKADRARDFARLRGEQDAAIKQAVEAFHTRMRASKTQPATALAAWEALRLRQAGERTAISADIGKKRASARAQLIARQQNERSTLHTHHRAEWQAFNRRRQAQTAVAGRAASSARRNAAKAFRPAAQPLSPAEKALRAQLRKQTANQKRPGNGPGPSRGRRLPRP